MNSQFVRARGMAAVSLEKIISRNSMRLNAANSESNTLNICEYLANFV